MPGSVVRNREEKYCSPVELLKGNGGSDSFRRFVRKEVYFDELCKAALLFFDELAKSRFAGKPDHFAKEYGFSKSIVRKLHAIGSLAHNCESANTEEKKREIRSEIDGKYGESKNQIGEGQLTSIMSALGFGQLEYRFDDYQRDAASIAPIAQWACECRKQRGEHIVDSIDFQGVAGIVDSLDKAEIAVPLVSDMSWPAQHPLDYMSRELVCTVDVLRAAEDIRTLRWFNPPFISRIALAAGSAEIDGSANVLRIAAQLKPVLALLVAWHDKRFGGLRRISKEMKNRKARETDYVAVLTETTGIKEEDLHSADGDLEHAMLRTPHIVQNVLAVLAFDIRNRTD